MCASWRSKVQGRWLKPGSPADTGNAPDHRARQATDRLAAGLLWQDDNLVFASTVGTPLMTTTFGGSFARSLSPPGWAPRGCPENCGTRLCSCCSRMACRWKQSRCSLDTIRPPGPSWSTGTTSCLPLPEARRSWTRSSANRCLRSVTSLTWTSVEDRLPSAEPTCGLALANIRSCR